MTQRGTTLKSQPLIIPLGEVLGKEVGGYAVGSEQTRSLEGNSDSLRAEESAQVILDVCDHARSFACAVGSARAAKERAASSVDHLVHGNQLVAGRGCQELREELLHPALAFQTRRRALKVEFAHVKGARVVFGILPQSLLEAGHPEATRPVDHPPSTPGWSHHDGNVVPKRAGENPCDVRCGML